MMVKLGCLMSERPCVMVVLVMSVQSNMERHCDRPLMRPSCSSSVHVDGCVVVQVCLRKGNWRFSFFFR